MCSMLVGLTKLQRNGQNDLSRRSNLLKRKKPKNGKRETFIRSFLGSMLQTFFRNFYNFALTKNSQIIRFQQLYKSIFCLKNNCTALCRFGLQKKIPFFEEPRFSSKYVHNNIDHGLSSEAKFVKSLVRCCCKW